MNLRHPANRVGRVGGGRRSPLGRGLWALGGSLFGGRAVGGRRKIRSDRPGRGRDLPSPRPSPRLAAMGRLDGTEQHAARQAHPHQVQRRREGKRPLDRQARLADLRQPGHRQRQGVRRHQQRRRLRQALSGFRRPGLPALLRREDGQIPLAGFQPEAAAGPRQRLAPAGRLQHALLPRATGCGTSTTAAKSSASTPTAFTTARTTAPTRPSRTRTRTKPTSSGSTT